MNYAERLRVDFEADHPRTRKLLAVLPDDKFEWKPHHKSMSLRQLGGHLAESLAWSAGMTGEKFDLAANDWTPFEPANVAEILEHYDEGVRTVQGILAGLDEEAMCSTWTLCQGEQILKHEPRHEALRWVLLSHQAHHRGQLSVYLRLLEIPVPAVFGPTADDPTFA